MPLLPELTELAISMARDAGEVLRGYATRRAEGDDIGVTTKGSATDPVSAADRAAEQLVSDRLQRHRPSDGLLGEEGQASRSGSSGLRWVVDPLDGTVNFLYGHPMWSVSIACEDDHGPLVGVVHHPERDETFWAVRDGGAFLGDGALAVGEVPTLEQTLVATGFSYDPDVRVDQARDLVALIGSVRDVRRGGSAALDLAWCAAGRVDGYLEFDLSPWDWAAGGLIVTEAGGIVTRHERRLGGAVRDGLVAGGEAVSRNLVDWLSARPVADAQVQADVEPEDRS